MKFLDSSPLASMEDCSCDEIPAGRDTKIAKLNNQEEVKGPKSNIHQENTIYFTKFIKFKTKPLSESPQQPDK